MFFRVINGMSKTISLEDSFKEMVKTSYMHGFLILPPPNLSLFLFTDGFYRSVSVMALLCIIMADQRIRSTAFLYRR